MAYSLYRTVNSCHIACNSFVTVICSLDHSFLNCTALQGQRWGMTRPPVSPFISQRSLRPALMMPSSLRQTRGEAEADPQSGPQNGDATLSAVFLSCDLLLEIQHLLLEQPC